jgi:hypothetical protein
MTPIESIYEIQSVVLDLQCYLQSKDKVVSYRAQERYEQWVNRFFRENKSFIKPEEILSRVVYEELGGDPFFFNTVDEFHSLHNISQALRTM